MSSRRAPGTCRQPWPSGPGRASEGRRGVSSVAPLGRASGAAANLEADGRPARKKPASEKIVKVKEGFGPKPEPETEEPAAAAEKPAKKAKASTDAAAQAAAAAEVIEEPAVAPPSDDG